MYMAGFILLEIYSDIVSENDHEMTLCQFFPPPPTLMAE